MELIDAIEVARPAGQVFELIADYANDAAWRAGVRVMRADGPVVPGTTTHEELSFLGSVYVTRGVVTERTATRLAFRGENATSSVEGFREVVPVEGGARITYCLRLELHGALRLFAPVLRPIYARRIAGDLGRLKQIIEAAPLVSPETACRA